MSNASPTKSWLRDPNQRATQLPILHALRPKRAPTRLRDRLWRVIWHTLIEFHGEKIALRSAALTYISLLSLVPLLAVAFAIIKAIGQEDLREKIRELIFTNLVPGTAEQIGTYLDNFIARASSGALGSLGGFFLIVSALTLLNNIELSLNEIWGVQRRRSLLRQAIMYWCAITLGPILVSISLVMSSAVRAQIEQIIYVPRVLFTLVPLGVTILVFSLLYIVVPNARVRTFPALIAAFITGVAWEIAKYGYALYALRSISYNAIYGSLGAIPLFLLWIYVSWFIFLTGARLGFALQHAITRTPCDPRVSDGRARELLYVHVCLNVASAFLASKSPPTAKLIAQALDLDTAYVAEAARALIEAGILAQGAQAGLVPLRPPSKIQLAEVVRAARARPCQRPADSSGAIDSPLLDLFDDADRQGMAPFERMTLAKLVSEVASCEGCTPTP
ncbi:MAG: YihY family inner membrane protein [Myxococcales bacterium]|jgi:membrane protein|nr:YihY family inner membrane protein [Myxococcales bacterium]